MVEPAGTMYCYHFDATGHTVALTDNTKTIVNAYAYTPFGTIANQQENVVQPFKFVGQYGVMAEDNSWYYMRARYYDPAMGRFISEDPLGFDGGDVNLYAYASNNPINMLDPSGLCSKWNPLNYLAVTFSHTFLGKGVEINDGIEQYTVTPLEAVGASVNLYVGSLPSSDDVMGEIYLEIK